VVKVTGWLGDRLIVGLNPAPTLLWWRPCGVAWDAIPKPMVEYINPDFFWME
jgi:hypothetical protein